MSKEKHKCEGETRPGSYGFRGHRCGKTASLNEDGKWYCRIHAPSIVKAKDETRDAKYRRRADADWALRAAQMRVSVAERKIIDTVMDNPNETSWLPLAEGRSELHRARDAEAEAKVEYDNVMGGNHENQTNHLQRPDGPRDPRRAEDTDAAGD